MCDPDIKGELIVFSTQFTSYDGNISGILE